MVVIVLISVGLGSRLFFDPRTSFECAIGLAFLGQTKRYLCGSVFEDAVARGFLFDVWHQLTRRWGLGLRNFTAICTTALIFALLHLGNPNITLTGFMNLTLVGVLFGQLFLISGDLWIPIGAHFAWNFVQNNVFGLPNGGQASKVAWFGLDEQSPSVMSGGPLGPEGWLVTTLVLLVAIAGLWRNSIRLEPAWQAARAAKTDA